MRGITTEVTERTENTRLHAVQNECSIAWFLRKRRISSVSCDLPVGLLPLQSKGLQA